MSADKISVTLLSLPSLMLDFLLKLSSSPVLSSEVSCNWIKFAIKLHDFISINANIIYEVDNENHFQRQYKFIKDWIHNTGPFFSSS
jgi:hypothetical protein